MAKNSLAARKYSSHARAASLAVTSLLGRSEIFLSKYLLKNRPKALSCHFGHIPALFRAGPAGAGAFGAVFHALVSLALFSTGIAYLGAHGACCFRKDTVSGHVPGSPDTGFRTVLVHLDAHGQFFHVLLVQACGSTRIARFCAVVASFNAFLVFVLF